MQLRIIPRIHPFRPFTTSHIKIIWKDRLSFYPKKGLVRTSCRIPTLLLRRCYRKRGYIPMTKETCNSVSEQSMSIQHFRFVFSEDSIACCLWMQRANEVIFLSHFSSCAHFWFSTSRESMKPSWSSAHYFIPKLIRLLICALFAKKVGRFCS